MARIARGQNVLAKAQGSLAKTKDADELRTIQAVIFPLVNGMSTQETAKAIGRSLRWTTKARNEFIRNLGIVKKTPQIIRNRAHMTRSEEKDFLSAFFEKARNGGILVVSEIRKAMELRLGHKVALSSAYNLLHRNGWRKLIPYKRHMKTDKEAQEEWKKNFQPCSHKLRRNGE